MLTEQLIYDKGHTNNSPLRFRRLWLRVRVVMARISKWCWSVFRSGFSTNLQLHCQIRNCIYSRTGEFVASLSGAMASGETSTGNRAGGTRKHFVCFSCQKELMSPQKQESCASRGNWELHVFWCSLLVSTLTAPAAQITVYAVPPFIPNKMLEKELRRYGTLTSELKTVNLGCKDPRLQHVQSFRRQCFMFLDSPTQTLDASFRVKYDGSSYTVYASSGEMKCFECDDVGYKRCLHKQQGGKDTWSSSY